METTDVANRTDAADKNVLNPEGSCHTPTNQIDITQPLGHTSSSDIRGSVTPQIHETDTSITFLDHTNSFACTSSSTDTNVSHQPQLIPAAESTPINPKKTETLDKSTLPMIKNDTTFSEVLNHSEDTPLSRAEEQLNTHFISRKFRENPKEQTILCKTKGQPITLQRVVRPRKDTQTVRTPTKRKRTHLLQKFRTTVAGTSSSSTDTQLASELKRISVERRRNIQCSYKSYSQTEVKHSTIQCISDQREVGTELATE